MSWSVQYHLDFEADVAAAADWYAGIDPRLKTSFLDHLLELMESISSDPARLPVLEGKFRFQKMKRFPYFIVFQIEQSTLYIHGLFHVSRSPGHGKAENSLTGKCSRCTLNP
jgi:hypothetical protein